MIAVSILLDLDQLVVLTVVSNRIISKLTKQRNKFIGRQEIQVWDIATAYQLFRLEEINHSKLKRPTQMTLMMSCTRIQVKQARETSAMSSEKYEYWKWAKSMNSKLWNFNKRLMNTLTRTIKTYSIRTSLVFLCYVCCDITERGSSFRKKSRHRLCFRL